MEIIFWLSILIEYYIYDGYLRLLQLMSLLQSAPKKAIGFEMETLPRVTVLLTVFNEAVQVRERILNILESDYPAERLEVLVASDCSTDDTDIVVGGIKDSRVRLFRPQTSVGKTDTQNKAVSAATGEIIVFTDADTRFDKMFLRNIVAPFALPAVGGVDGHLLFTRGNDSGVSRSQSAYWRYELRLRELESRLGVLAVASGACLAIRRNLFQPMDVAIGEDCIVPLDVVRRGYRMVHASNAIAYDRMENDSAREFKIRVRMTLRNWRGTWSRPELLNPLRNAGYAFALWSHKLLRWLSPLFLLSIMASAFAMSVSGSAFFKLVTAGLAGFYIAGLAGWQAEARNWRVPVVCTVYSFLLANLGFLVGLWKALHGESITQYRQLT